MGGGGVWPGSKSFEAFLPIFLDFGPLKSYLTVVQNGPIQKLPHNAQNKGGGWVKATFNVQKKDAFYVFP